MSISRAERAERQIHERRVAGERRVHVERWIGPNARAESMPCGGQRGRAWIIRRLREQIHVEKRGLVHVVACARERRSAVIPQPRVEAGDLRAEQTVVLRPEGVPLGPIVGRVPGEDRRDEVVLHLARVARDDPCPRPAARGDGRERDHVVLDDRVRSQLAEDLGQAVVHVHRPVDQRLPCGLQERLELRDRRLAELRRRLADEVLPELTGHLRLLGRRREAHRRLFESLRLERAGERSLHHEDHPVPALLEHVGDPDAVVGRPERPLGEEHDRLRVRHGSPPRISGGGSLVNGHAQRIGWDDRPHRSIAPVSVLTMNTASSA